MKIIVISNSEQIFKKVISKNLENLDLNSININENTIDDFFHDVSSISLFADEKNYIFNEVSFFEKKNDKTKKEMQEKFINLIDESEDNFYIRTTKNLFGDLSYSKKIFETFEIIDLSDDKIFMKDLLNSFIKNKNIEISNRDLDLLKLNLDNDMDALLNELDKLSLFNKNIITREIINLLSYKTIEENVFTFIELVIKRDVRKSRLLFDSLITSGTSPIKLLEIFATQIKFYYQVKILSEKYNSKEIAQLLFSNTYRIDKTISIVNSISIFTISNIYIKTSKVENSVKSGLINENLVFDLIIQ